MKKRLTLVCASLIVFGLILTGQSFAAINMDNIVALWLFDDDEAEITDSTGNGHDGVIENPNWTEGKLGGGLEFEGLAGDANYVVIPHHEDFNFGDDGDFTIGFWVDSRKADAYIMVKRNGGRWWNLNSAIDRGGDSFCFEYNAGGNDFLDGTTQIVNTGWRHCAAVREDGTLSLYVDGELDVSEPVGNIDSEADIDIGGWGGAENFVGIIDEVFIARVTLTPEDLKIIMNGWEKLSVAVSSAGKAATIWGAIKAQ